MKRILIIISVVLLLVTVIVVPVAAAEIDGDLDVLDTVPDTQPISRAVVTPPGEEGTHVAAYGFTALFGNFVGNSNVLRGDFKLEITLPYNELRYATSPQPLFTSFSALEISLAHKVFDDDDYFMHSIWFMGRAPQFANSFWYVDLSTFPVDCMLTLSGLDYDYGAPYGTPYEGIEVEYYDKDLNYVGQDRAYAEEPGGITGGASIGISLRPYGEESAYARISIILSQLTFFSEFNGTYYWRLNDFKLGVTFPSQDNTGILYDILGATNGTNELIEKILGIWEGDVKPIVPGGTGDLDADINDALENASDGFGIASDIMSGILNSITSAASGFYAVAWIFNLFYGIPYFSLLLQLSLTIGLFGAMCGIVGSFVSRFGSRNKGG